MKYLYGPVPSRRLGRSLGIDPYNRKVCTHNCIYCQLGSAPTVSSESSVAGAPIDEVENELSRFFAGGGDTDFITFSGSGEPTLWTHLAELCNFIRQHFPDKKLAVITNGTTLWRDDVQIAIANVDIIVPTISTADENIYKKLHRPHPDADFERYLSGLTRFSNIFNGEIWAEVMLVAGVNDDYEHIRKLASLIDRNISPLWIDLNTPVRPPAESWVKPPAPERIAHICKLLGNNCRIVGKYHSTHHISQKITDLMEKAIQILSRRPETADGIASALGTDIKDAEDALEALVAKKIATREESGYYRLR